MRLYSTAESVEKGEYSFLAIIESLLAVAASLWFAWEYQTITHIIIASCVAPLLLLRTEESTKRGLSLFSSFWDKFNFERTEQRIFFVGIVLSSLIVGFIFGKATMIVWVVLGIAGHLILWLGRKGKINFHKMPLIVDVVVTAVLGTVEGGVAGVGVVVESGIRVVIVSLVSQLWATIVVFFTSWWESVKAIPVNWSRIVFSVDTRHPPEIISGIESERYKLLIQDTVHLRFGEVMNYTLELFHKNDSVHKFIGLLFLCSIFIFYLPALAYRWSLKSSSIVWLPLIYIIGAKDEKCDEKDNNKRLQITLANFRNSMWAKLLFAYNLIILCFFLIQFVMMSKTSLLLESLEANPRWLTILNIPIVQYFFVLKPYFNLWHYTWIGATIFSLALFFYADRLLLARKEIPDYGLKSAPYIIRTVYHLLIIPLSLFTIGCGLYLLLLPINWYSIWANMQILPF